jgi:uncharacterized membrane protein YoaK (UPF0700 family)
MNSRTGGTCAAVAVRSPILWLIVNVASESPTNSRRDETHLSRRSASLLPGLLSMTAGAVDVISFLGFGGLFTAHITGNLVILAAHYITGRFGEIAPLLSVPVFVLVVGIVTEVFVRKPIPFIRRALLVLQAVLLASLVGLSVGLGPFADPNNRMAVFAGMVGVAAMATQNAVVRLALPGHPTTAVISTNATELAVDLAMLVRCLLQPTSVSKIRSRAHVTAAAVFGFAVGVVAGAILETHFGLWSLTFPSLLAVLAIPLSESWTASS